MNTSAVIDLTHTRAGGGYTLELSFADGRKPVVDLEPFLRWAVHPELSKYLDPDLFAQHAIEHRHLQWNDFNLVFPVADLYEGRIG